MKCVTWAVWPLQNPPISGTLWKSDFLCALLPCKSDAEGEWIHRKEILIPDKAKRPYLFQKKEASTGWGRWAFQPFALVNLGNPHPDTNPHWLDSTARVCTPATRCHKAEIPLSITSLRETESNKMVFDPPPAPLLIMDCFGLLHMCNQMLLLFTHSSLCLNWEGSCLNIYLNNNIPWVLCKLLYKTNPKHYFKNLIKLVFCLSTVLWASASFY